MTIASLAATAAPGQGLEQRAAPSTADSLEAYAHRTALLRAKALETSRVNYADVIVTAYATGMVTDDVRRRKAVWREQLAASARFTFLTDYTLVDQAAAVRPLVAVADPVLKSRLVAQYEATQHVISLAPAASDFSVLHEAGHALQRAALRSRGSLQGRRAASHASEDHLEAALLSGRADATSVRRLRYLTSQDELEVRLQDLNRFHAICVGDRPILDAHDTLRALAALGMPLTYDEASAAFAAGQQTLTREAFAAATKIVPVNSAVSSVAFEDARELCLMRRLALRVDATYWPRLLEKIIFEAPGHL